MTAYLIFIGCLAALRIWELRVSKQNWQSHQKSATMLREKLFVAMVVLHSSFFVLVPLELFLRTPHFGGLLSWAALATTAVAFAIRIWTLGTLGRSWNVRVVYGKTYPIVHTGPYRFIRHPNYLVVVLELAAIPMMFNLYWSALVLSVGNFLVLAKRIQNEEAVLFKNPQWVATMSAKPRFFPRLWG